MNLGKIINLTIFIQYLTQFYNNKLPTIILIKRYLSAGKKFPYLTTWTLLLITSLI